MNIPVLTYHAVTDASNIYRDPFTVSRGAFDGQMRYICESSFKTVLLSDLVKHPDGKKENKLLVLSFDDGHTSSFLNAYPTLKSYNLVATFFVVVSKIGTANFMTWDQLLELQANGMDVQSHTLTHRPLETMATSAIKEELSSSKRILEGTLNKSVSLISFPHGSYDKKVIEMTKQAGYIAAFTSKVGYFDLRKPYEISRILMRTKFSKRDFRNIVDGNQLFLLRLKALYLAKFAVRKVIGVGPYLKLHNKVYGGVD